MKVLWLGRKLEFQNSTVMFDLRNSLSKLVEIDFFSAIKQDKNDTARINYDVPSLVKQLESNVVVIGPFSSDYKSWMNLDKVEIPKAIFCSDPQKDIPEHVYFIKEQKIDLALLVYKSWIDKYKDKINCKVEHMPWCLMDRYNPNLEKTTNLIYAPAGCGVYPLRYTLYKHRKQIAEYFNGRPVGGSDYRLPQKEYMETLNKSRIYAFDNSFWDFGVIKWIETAMMECLIMSDGDQLNFVDQTSYVKINNENWYHKIKYYIKNELETERIAKEGRKVFLKYHTSDIRAKELFNILKEI